VPYYTRVLSKDSEFPSVNELSQRLRADHPDFRLTIEEGTEEEWESALLSGTDGVEVAIVERNPVSDGSVGQDEISDFMEDLYEAKPEVNVEWLTDYLESVKTIYTFQHLQGTETVEGSNALHALRTALMDRGDAILQADHEGFTNEEGYHVVWQFSDSVSGPWNMALLQDGTWLHFSMDLGDPDHRDAFLSGEAPSDVATVKSAGRHE
jgi:hypothetical protein